MLISLCLTASFLIHPKAASQQSPKPFAHSHRRPHARRARHLRATMAVKGNIQFIRMPPPEPSAALNVRDVPQNLAALRITTQAQEEREEQALVAAINAERTQRGLEPLRGSLLLTETARAHSQEMAAADYFDHQSPTPGLQTPMDRYLKSMREWGADQPSTAMIGENIFYCSVSSDLYNMDYAHRCLMSSPGHRANILEPRFTKVGVGVFRDDRGRFWVTEMFLRDTE